MVIVLPTLNRKVPISMARKMHIKRVRDVKKINLKTFFLIVILKNEIKFRKKWHKFCCQIKW